jgi:16S rRNA (guanine(966)-N(2))-methyltransferase RsmD
VVRVIAGAMKGRRLVAPRGLTTRPTADQVRIALMDTLTPWLSGARVLDLFAGAGGVGLEALSRGAAHVTFVERDARAFAALEANVRALGLEAVTRRLRLDVGRALARLAGMGERFEIVFLDPPYEPDLVTDTLARLGEGALTAPGALVIAQHFTKRPPPDAVGTLAAFRTRRFGETTLTFFRAGGYSARR